MQNENKNLASYLRSLLPVERCQKVALKATSFRDAFCVATLTLLLVAHEPLDEREHGLAVGVADELGQRHEQHLPLGRLEQPRKLQEDNLMDILSIDVLFGPFLGRFFELALKDKSS